MNRSLLLGCVTLILAESAGASEFRRIQPIATPQTAGVDNLGPVVRPVAPMRIRDAVDVVYDHYNRGDFGTLLADGFYDRQRLADAITEQVPRNAVLRVLAIGNTRTFGQTLERRAGAPDVLLSVVSVTVRAQLERTTPEGGFERREGTHELLLHIYEEYQEEYQP